MQDNKSFRDTYKWWFLGALLIAQFSPNFNDSATGTMQTALQEKMGLTEIGYSHLAQASILPSLLIPLISGVLTDRFGALPGYTVSMITILAGQLITVAGAYSKSLWMLMIGKAVNLAGYESSLISRSKFFKEWFDSREIGRVFGFSVFSQTLAMILCDVAYPNLYEYSDSLGFPFLVGGGVAVVSFIFGAIALILHRRFMRTQESTVAQTPRSISLKPVKTFPFSFWVLVLACMLGSVAFYLTKIYESKFLQIRFNFSIGQAGDILAVAQATPLIATPLMGS